MKRTALTLLVGVIAGASLGVPASIAAKQLTGKDVKNESLTSKDIRDGSLKSQDFSQTYTWNVAVRSDSQNVSAQALPAGSVVVPIRAELTSQFCGAAPIDNPGAAYFQIKANDGLAETVVVDHPFELQPFETGATPDHLTVTLPGCGAQVVTATLVFTFEVRAGGQGKAKAFG